MPKPGAPIGTSATCHKCGGTNEWTGKERRGNEVTGVGNNTPKEYVLLGEYRCTSCGRRGEIEIGTTTP